MTIATALPHDRIKSISAAEAPAGGIRFARLLRPFFAMVALFALTSSGIKAQTPDGTDVTMRIGGLVQAETSVGWTTDSDDDVSRIGFGLRRTRLLASVGVGPKFGAFIHVDGDNGSFGVLDAYASYQANERVRLRAGRMASAQPRAFILTPVNAMDATERAAIALLSETRAATSASIYATQRTAPKPWCFSTTATAASISLPETFKTTSSAASRIRTVAWTTLP